MSEFWRKLTRTDVRNIISVLYILLALGYLYVLMFKTIPPDNKDIINIMGGTIMAGVGVILSFYFGDKKSDATSEITVKKQGE